jgi:hypothetical protein
MASKRPFAINPVLTAIVMGYANGELIADSVLPRVPVAGEQFKYTEYGREDFRVENDLVGRTGRVSEVEFSGTQQDGSVVDRGLESPIPQSDIDQAAKLSNFDPKRNAAMKLRKKIALGRESRVAAMTFNAANYPAGNKATLSGTSQWSDYTNSTPLDDILDAKESMIWVPNTLVLGSEVANKIRRHPQLIKAFHGNLGDEGVVPLSFLAEMLDFDRVLVGRAFMHSANKGQTESLGRVWGKHCAMLKVESDLQDTEEATFGMSPTFGTAVAMERQDDDIGLRGGVRIRVGESINEMITVGEFGYLFTDAIA